MGFYISRDYYGNGYAFVLNRVNWVITLLRIRARGYAQGQGSNE